MIMLALYALIAISKHILVRIENLLNQTKRCHQTPTSRVAERWLYKYLPCTNNFMVEIKVVLSLILILNRTVN